MSIDFNFEFSAPRFVDFTAMQENDADDSWFEKYEDVDSHVDDPEEFFAVETTSTPARPLPFSKKPLTKPSTPKLQTTAYNKLKFIYSCHQFSGCCSNHIMPASPLFIEKTAAKSFSLNGRVWRPLGGSLGSCHPLIPCS